MKTGSKNGDFCSPYYRKSTVTIELSATAAIQILNAFVFAVENKKDFQKRVGDCPDCWLVLEKTAGHFNKLVEGIEEHRLSHHTN